MQFETIPIAIRSQLNVPFSFICVDVYAIVIVVIAAAIGFPVLLIITIRC